MAKNTNKITSGLLLPMAVVLILSACGKNETPDPVPVDGVQLHTVWDMNKEEAVINSHAGEELYSTLQPIYECYQVIPHAKLIGSNPGENWACYPRIKRMADGRFIMLYHRSQYGAYIWYVTSDDLLTWSAPKELYRPYQVQVTYPDGKTKNDNRHFVNPDAVVLPNGDLLMVCSYRATGSYGEGLDSGLSFRLSKDNAKTWGQPYEVPVGSNWEAYMLLLPDGTLQCYYTGAIPQTRNSGTAMITSKDNGRTWSAPKRVCQQYKYQYKTTSVENRKQYNGQYIYTDQMPCFRILNDGKTICGWLEARLERPVPNDCAADTYSSNCMMSLVRNHSLDWADLGSDGSYLTSRIEGPQDRESNVMKGAGGYVATFPSGEVVISCGLDSKMTIKIGNASATAWRGGSVWTNGLIRPLEGKGYWSTTEVFDQNYMAIAMHSQESATNGMQVGALYLNHRVDAPVAGVTVDGDASEWTATRALYLSVPSKEDVIMRFSRDDSKLYIAAECRDGALSPGTELALVLSNGSLSGNLRLNSKGLVSSTLAGTAAVARTALTPSGQKGWVAEASVRLDALGAGAGDTLLCYAEFVAGGNKATFTLSDTKDKETWQRIKLQ